MTRENSTHVIDKEIKDTSQVGLGRIPVKCGDRTVPPPLLFFFFETGLLV